MKRSLFNWKTVSKWYGNNNYRKLLNSLYGMETYSN